MAQKKKSSVKKAMAKAEQVRSKKNAPLSGWEENRKATEGMTAAGRVAWYTLLTLIFLVPLALSNLTFLGFDLPLSADIYDNIKVTLLRIGVMVALVAWLYDLLKHGGKLRTSPVYWIFGAFLVWASISTLTSISPVTSFFGKYRRYEGLWSYFLYAGLFFLVVQYATSELRVKMLAKPLIYSSAIVALYGLGQSIGIEPIMRGVDAFEAGRSYSTYGNPDLLAGFLAFGTFVTFGLALAERSIGRRVVYWFIFLMNSAVVVTAYSRSIWVGFAVGMVAMILFAVRQRTRLQGSDWGFLGATGVATVAYIATSLTRDNAVTNFGSRLVSIFQFNEGSSLTRFEIWSAALNAIKDRPIFGFGPDTFRLVFRRYAPVAYAQDAGYLSVADNVHNYLLQMAAGIGIVGCALYYAMAFWIAGITFKLGFTPAEKDESISKSGRLIYGGLWSACLAYMVHLFFGLSLPGASFLLFIFMGALIAPTARERECAPVKLAPVALGAGCVVCAIISIFSMRLFSADYAYMKGDAYASSDPVNAVQYYKRATELNPYNDRYRTEYFSSSASLALQALSAAQNKQISQQEADTYLTSAEKAGEEAISFMPWEYDNYSMIGLFYDQVGDMTGDKAYYEKAVALVEPQIKLTPTGLALRYAYAKALIGLGRIDEARTQLEVCVTQDSNFEAAKTLLESLASTKTVG